MQRPNAKTRTSVWLPLKSSGTAACERGERASLRCVCVFLLCFSFNGDVPHGGSKPVAESEAVNWCVPRVSPHPHTHRGNSKRLFRSNEAMDRWSMELQYSVQYWYGRYCVRVPYPLTATTRRLPQQPELRYHHTLGPCFFFLFCLTPCAIPQYQ